MDFILAKDLSNHSYILSGRKSFLYRFCDTGFKTKWTGLWYGPKKFLDYFAFKVNSKWLSPSNNNSFELGEIDAKHFFSVDDLTVKEFVFVPDNFPSLISLISVKNDSDMQKEIEIELEVAANIRDRDENWHDRMYKVKSDDKRVIVSSEKGTIVFGSPSLGNFDISGQYKDHYPSDEKQRCYIPGKYVIKSLVDPKLSNNVFFIFSLGENEGEALSNYDSIKNSLFTIFLEKDSRYKELLSNNLVYTGINELDELFKCNVVSLEKLAFDSKLGFGYFAGFPWYTQFWGRDLGWILPAVVDLGNFEDAKKALTTLANFQNDNGEIPNLININGSFEYNSADATPLWIIALHSYVMNSADTGFLKSIKDKLFKALEWCSMKGSDKDGFIEYEGRTTWMDTLNRGAKALEVQAFLASALRAGSDLTKILWDDGKEAKDKAIRIEQKFEKEFWNEKNGFYFDSISKNSKDDTKTINSVFPIFFGISRNAKKILDKLESDDFTTQFGVRTLSKTDTKYNPAGYHNGSVWGFTTALLACAEFRSKRPDKGIEYLKTLYNNLGQNCVGALGEAWNSETNDVLLSKESLKEPGACLQAWSSALVVRCIDEFMLGMKVNALDDTIVMTPSLSPGAKILRRKRIGNDIVDFSIKRIGNKIDVKYESQNKKEYKIILSPMK